MQVSDLGCASLMKSILCSKCDQFSAELYRTESVPREVPVLCSTTASSNSSQYQHGEVDFCTKVWDECGNVSISSSPFAFQGDERTTFNSTSKLSDIWQSRSDFCDAFGGSSNGEMFCFDGGPVLLNNTEIPSPPSGMCLEKIGNGSYLNMVPHPDGSNRVFLSDQSGKVWLAAVPEEGSGEMLVIGESNLFLDPTDQVYSDTRFGVMGLAFHPNYVQNGRFFASYNCDKVRWSECSGRCSCNSDVGCDPSKLGSDSGAQPCQYHSIISEFTANGTTSQLSSVTMGLPFTSHHGGQILFGPKDVYLYFMMGDGGSIGDPYNFSQNKKSLLGKIMRLDIDNLLSSSSISNLGLWGNYSVPGDNPFSEDKELQPEIWALGFRNPWRCSFDLERPSYFLCADVGQDQYEEVDIVTKGGNYGWRAYEGAFPYRPPKSPGGNTSTRSMNAISPVMGYSHSDVNKAEGSASITGGYFYRSMTDPCLYGRYTYADLYAGQIWAGTEIPEGSGNFTGSIVPISCAVDSPIQCSARTGSSIPALGFIFSFGQDNRKVIFILASTGVYRVARPSRCNYTCSKENATSFSHPGSVPSPSPSPSSSSTTKLHSPVVELLLFYCLMSLLFGF